MPLMPSSYIGAPTCDKCGSKLIVVEECGNGIIIMSCMYCDDPEPIDFVYESICWKCGVQIDSRKCLKSNKPGGGWICLSCGADLHDWKVSMGIISNKEAVC